MSSSMGSDKFMYDGHSGTLCTMMMCRSSGLGSMFVALDWYLLIGFHVLVVVLYHFGIIPKSANKKNTAWNVEWNDIRIMTILALFQLVFNSMQCYKRYSHLHKLTMRLLRNVIRLTWMMKIFCGRVAPQYVRLQGRYHLAAAILFLESLKYKEDEKEAEEAALFTGLSTHILNDDEKAYLKEFNIHHRPLLLLQWVADIIKEAFVITQAEEGELEALKRNSNLKACMQRVDQSISHSRHIYDIRLLPTPFQVYHTMNLMVFVNIVFWAYFMGVTFAWSASVAYIGASLIFMNTERVARRLQDPFGEYYRLDFPIKHWCADCWLVVRTVLNLNRHPFQMQSLKNEVRSDDRYNQQQKSRSCDADVSALSLAQGVVEAVIGTPLQASKPLDLSNVEWDNKIYSEEVQVPELRDYSQELRNDGFGLGTFKDYLYSDLNEETSGDIEGGRGQSSKGPAPSTQRPSARLLIDVVEAPDPIELL